MTRIRLLLAALLVPAGIAAQVAPPALPATGQTRLHVGRILLDAQAPRHAASLHALGALRLSLAPVATAEELAMLPPLALDDQDPADGLYRQAREALNRNEYSRAAELFAQLRARYPRSSYTADAYFWEAFSRHRHGSAEGMRVALELLEQQRSRHPQASTLAEARTLEIRLQGELARRGDASSAAALAERAASIAPPAPPGTPSAMRPPAPPRAPRAQAAGRDRCAGEDEERVAALQALIQMDADRAMPILERVLATRDAESACLRRRAVFMVSQHRTDRTETVLLNAARSDPDAEVREQAIFWLAQTGSARAAAALDSILRTTSDAQIQKRALFSLAQMNAATAGPILRTYAGRADVDREVRDQAIFWLGQSGNAEHAGFLQELYARERDDQIKERILFAVSQMPRRSGAEYGQWLASIAANQSEPLKLRKNALFWAGQSGAPLTGIIQAYERIPDREMKEQAIFVLSQRREREATDKLLEIARTERDAHLRQRAIFWLTQRNDPRVADLLLEILERRP